MVCTWTWEKKKYEDLAAKDSARYREEKEKYKPPEPDSDDSEEEPKKKRKKKEKDPNAPKRAMSSYMFFTQDKRAEVLGELQKSRPGAKIMVGDVAKKLGEMWKTVTTSDKKKYEDLAAKDKERYIKAKAEYGSGKAPAKKKSKNVKNDEPEEEEQEEEEEGEDEDEEGDDDED